MTFDIGNLILGLSAGVLAWVTWNSNNKNSKRDRLVHIANKRQEWINDLRDCVSELLGICSTVIEEDVKDEEVFFYKYYFLISKIRLLLNPHEQKTKLLEEELNKLIDVENREVDFQFYEQMENVRKIVNEILKEEWDRIKVELGGKEYSKLKKANYN